MDFALIEFIDSLGTLNSSLFYIVMENEVTSKPLRIGPFDTVKQARDWMEK